MTTPRYTEAGLFAHNRLKTLPIFIDSTINEVGPRKRILGGVFSLSEFCTSRFSDRRNYPDDQQGPRLPIYFVMEQQSELIISCATTMQGALEAARDALTLADPELIEALILKRRLFLKREQISGQAQQEADQVIARARAPHRKTISKRARAVFAASEGKCHYCDKTLTLDGMWHIEHKIPRALFGGSEQSNLVASCAPCNHAKRDKTDLEFIVSRNA